MPGGSGPGVCFVTGRLVTGLLRLVLLLVMTPASWEVVALVHAVANVMTLRATIAANAPVVNRRMSHPPSVTQHSTKQHSIKQHSNYQQRGARRCISGPAVRVYPLHTNVVPTTFWVGEIFDSTASDGSQAIHL
jgi:hypothetical protein